MDLERFGGVFRRQSRVIRYMLDTLDRKNPYVVSEINKDMVLYAEVRGGRVIVNSFTPEELKALTGIEVKK